jgi:hypothetical protein
MTGDGRLLDKIHAIGEFLIANVPTRLLKSDQKTGLWTERNLGAALGGLTYAFEATGDPKFRTQVLAIIAGMREDAASPPTGYPSDMHGVLLHRPEVHEGDSYSDWIMSPWMSALLGESLWHYFLVSDDSIALTFLSDYSQFIAEKSIYNDPKAGYLSDLYYPYYISGLAGGHTTRGAIEDCEHAYDVMGLLKRGRWARKHLGLSTSLLDLQIQRLSATASVTFRSWIRSADGLPRYRLSPTRKFGWWFGTTADSSWFSAHP